MPLNCLELWHSTPVSPDLIQPSAEFILVSAVLIHLWGDTSLAANELIPFWRQLILSYIQPGLCQDPKKIRDPGSAGSKIWDLDGSWIQHFRVCRGILGILDPTCSFCREILMDPGSWFSLHRGILGILDPAILPCRGILGILDPDILFCVGFRGSWILDFWHCMGSRGSCVSNFWQMHRL